MTTDRRTLGLAWRRQVAAALTRTGHAVAPADAVIDGPQCCQVAMLTRDPVAAADLAALPAVIAHALNIAADVRLERRGRWLVVELPWPDRRAIPLAKMRADGLKLELGITPTGDRVTVDLHKTPHMLIAGQTGSGKSELLRSAATLLARANAPTALPFVAVDYDVGHPEAAMTPLARLAHLARPVASTLADSRAALEWVVSTYVNGNAPTGCVVLVDEGAELRADRRSVTALTAIAQRGRKRGVHLILAAQRSTESVARNIVTQFGARVCGVVSDYHESNTIIGVSGAERLLGHGDMLARVGGVRIVRFQAALTAPSDVAALPVGDPLQNLDNGDESLEPVTDSDAEALAWAIQRGRERRNGWTVASTTDIRQRFGVGADKAREIRDVAEAVKAYLLTASGDTVTAIGPALAEGSQ